MKTRNLYLLVSLVVLSVIFGLLWINRGIQCKNPPTIPEVRVSESGDTYSVTEITVLAGNEFDLKLENGKRIHAKLVVNTVPDAKYRVINYLNETQKPRVVILGKQGDTWMVDLHVRMESQASLWKEVSLTNWLKENELVWEDL